MISVLSSFLTSMSQWPWLKFIPVLIPLLITLWEIRSDKKKKSVFRKVILPLLSLFAVLITCWILVSDEQSSAVAKKQLAEQLNRVEGRLGDQDATRRYIDAVSELSRQLTAQRTAGAVTRFFSAADERKKIRDEINQINARVITAYEVQLNPIRDYILAKFDSWVAELKKRNIDVELEAADIPTVMPSPSSGGNARRVTFKNGDVLLMQTSAAGVRNSKLEGRMEIRLAFGSNRAGVSSGHLALFEFKEDEYRAVAETHWKHLFETFDGKGKNPIQDKDFLEAIENAIDESMGFALDEILR